MDSMPKSGLFRQTINTGLNASSSSSFALIKSCHTQLNNKSYKKAVLPQGNRAMPQVFFTVEVRQQHSLQV